MLVAWELVSQRLDTLDVIFTEENRRSLRIGEIYFDVLR